MNDKIKEHQEVIIERDDDEKSRAVEIFDSFRDELYKRQLSNSEAYDKAILSLSSAGLALSLTFIKFIVPLQNADYLILLKTSWVLFLISVITTIFSFLIGNKGISTQLKYAEEYYIDGKASAFNKFNVYSYLNSKLNYASGGLFLIALTCVVGFVTLNINNGESKMKKGNKTFVTDSATIPSMQRVDTSGIVKKSADIPSMGKAPGTDTTSQGAGNSPKQSDNNKEN